MRIARQKALKAATELASQSFQETKTSSFEMASKSYAAVDIKRNSNSNNQTKSSVQIADTKKLIATSKTDGVSKMYSSQARIIKNYDYSAVGGDPAIPPLER